MITPDIKLNESFWEFDKSLETIRMFLPEKINPLGRPPSIGTIKVEQKFRWPSVIDVIGKRTKAKLMAFAMQKAVHFFFKNFMYHFGGETYLQMDGGPIGARLTMAIARLVMQQWKEDYNLILEKSKITEYLSALYVDDGRSLQRKLIFEERFDVEEKIIRYSENNELKD